MTDARISDSRIEIEEEWSVEDVLDTCRVLDCFARAEALATLAARRE